MLPSPVAWLKRLRYVHVFECPGTTRTCGNSLGKRFWECSLGVPWLPLWTHWLGPDVATRKDSWFPRIRIYLLPVADCRKQRYKIQCICAHLWDFYTSYPQNVCENRCAASLLKIDSGQVSVSVYRGSLTIYLSPKGRETSRWNTGAWFSDQLLTLSFSSKCPAR